MFPRRSTRLKKIILFLFGAFVFIHFASFRQTKRRPPARDYRYFSNPPVISQNLEEQTPIIVQKQDNFSIVLLPYGNHPSRSGKGYPKPTANVRGNCSLSFDCFIYNDMNKDFPKAAIDKFSAILAWGAGHSRFLSLYKEVGGVAARPREQFWISTALESGINSGNGNHMKGISHLFNWTAASGRNVTFQVDNFLIEKMKQKLIMEMVEKDVKQHIANKTHFVCWAMNNCALTFTNRVKLAKDLVKHLPEKLQLFGHSGSRCMKGLNEFIDYYGHTPGHVTEDIRQRIDNCMFYLSFENSNCTDYVTEKFSNPLISYAIPIVNGWKETYQKRMPGSFIYYNDFATAKELSEYMQYLRSNWTAFMEYHKWRQFYTVQDLGEAQDKLYCDICKRLKQEKDSGYQKTYTIPNVSAFYRTMQTCVRR
ncbi:4-galactosyl-N-acetylglucosaminide 3-alpha-L-fucosyltransferase 9-like [Convolutriloba macropyga]|uniref:4-galactosyl-N-acetylglucosaminide 3-alpha-L-fucosyltransferase 9-like n=1 Tax=Convolutriloba macropyga TaxID=536237 RepID=UPI003F51BA43